MDGRWNHLRDVAGVSVILDTAVLPGSSSLFRWARVYRTANFSVGGPAVRERLLFLLDDIIMPLFSVGG